MRFVTVFGSSSVLPTSPAYAEAEAWGRTIGKAGFGVVTGGYFGVMEAACKGAKSVGATTVGVTSPALFPDRQAANAWVDVEFPSPTLMSRIERLIDLSEATIALPGGVGTLAEILIAWNVSYLDTKRRLRPRPIGVHPAWFDVLKVAVEIEPRHMALLTVVNDVPDLTALLQTIERGRAKPTSPAPRD